MEYLGYIISQAGVKVNPEKLKPLEDLPIPKNSTEVKRFIGMCSWYREYVPQFATIVEPLNECMRKSVRFRWDEKQQSAFDKIKMCIVNAAALSFPNFDKEFILRTDSSDVGLGAVLAQEDDEGNERPIAFASRTLSKTERSYHTTEKECLAIVRSLQKFEAYLDGQPFQLQTDNKALIWLDRMKDAGPCVYKISSLLFPIALVH